MNIGFDLDKIFINFPPFVPSKIIDLFYKERTNHELKYRIPSKAEQIIRIFSHHPLLRFPITQNLNYLNNLALANNNKYYLIKRYRLDKIFKAMYFNYENKQPHQFKNEVIGKLNLGMYVDDDLQLLEYLIDKNPKTKFFWLNNKISKPLKKNLFAIKHLSEMFA